MSFLKKVFGFGSPGDSKSDVAPTSAKTLEYNGYLIRATPFKERERFQVCGVISREVDGVVKEETFIRADAFSTFDDAAEVTFQKARKIIDDRAFDLPR